MRISVYVDTCMEHVSNWIKTAMKHEEACSWQRVQKIKIHFYQSRRSQHVANACWTSSHCVCVNMRERINGDVLRFVTVAFGSDNVRKTDRSRFAEPNRLYIWCLHIWWQDRICTILFNWPPIDNDTFLC